MARPTRHFIPGHVWHITHRCHNKNFLLDYQFYRKLWIKWLYEGISRYGVITLNFTVTCNHIHLLVLAPEDMEAIPRLMQLVASRVGQTFNMKRSRKGAFWENRYRATAVQTDSHLLRCLLYIDFNMVRAGVVPTPDKWDHCGYHEIVTPKKRYRAVHRNELSRLLSVNEKDLSNNYLNWVNEELEKSRFTREPCWSREVAVGCKKFVDSIKLNVGRYVKQPALFEEHGKFGEQEPAEGNMLEWRVFEDCDLG